MTKPNPPNPPATDRPAHQGLRSLGRIIGVLICAHLALFAAVVPAVVGHEVARLCVEEGGRNVLTSGPGLALVAIIGLSAAATVAFALAGRACFRGDVRGAFRLVLAALVAGALTALAIVRR